MSRSTPILRNLLLVVLVRLSQEKCASSIKIFQIGCAYGAIGLTYETKRAMFVSTSALRAGRQQQPSHGRRKTHPARKSAFGLIPPGTPDSGRSPLVSKTQYKVDFTASVELYAANGKFLYRIQSEQARRLYRSGTAEDMLGSRIIRAMRLKAAPVEPVPGRSFVPTSQRLSGVGHTHKQHLGGKLQKPTVSWHLPIMGKQKRFVKPDENKPPVEIEVPIYAPNEVRDIYLAVLTEAMR